MMIKTTPEYINTLLVDLTFELKLLNLWQIPLPTEEALSSSAPFCCDTLAFEQWLQFIFIPKITMMINHQQALPSKISITPMAEEAFKHLSMSAKSVLGVIHKIDKALTEQGKQHD
ncbi:YqcC family protein [Colwellia psychrerythraea]|nr:YqcC family protein [Colwellia psychrerythraea]